MARLSLNLAVLLALAVLFVLPTTLAARPGFRPEEPPEIPEEPVPGANVQANPAGSPHGADPPFSGSGKLPLHMPTSFPASNSVQNQNQKPKMEKRSTSPIS